MSSSLFQSTVSHQADDDVQSVTDQPAAAPHQASAAQRGGAVFRGDGQARVLAGRGQTVPDGRKFRYDVVRGRGVGLPFSVSRDDRMDAVEAGAMLHDIHVMCGVATQNEDVLQAFDSALFFCHTVNGGSVLNPGRSKFNVRTAEGDGFITETFDYAKIRDKLGNDMRRFFRAYADETMEVNKRVMREYDPYNPYSQEQWGWLMEVAHDRGMMRFPHLAHDSADACLGLSSVERQALQASKVLVIGSTPNSADRMRPGASIQSADRFDSSIGQSFTA